MRPEQVLIGSWRLRAWTIRDRRGLTYPFGSAAYLSFFSYSGRWHVHGDVVFHEVELALNPNLVGTVQRRRLSIAGAGLDLSAKEDDGSGVREHVLSWQRT